MNIRHPQWAEIDPHRAELFAKIEAHPAFPRLVREVAVAEQGGNRRHAWLRLNSRSFGSWIDRCAGPSPQQGSKSRRAWALSERIAGEIALAPDWWPSQPREARASVFVCALQHVRARSNGRL